MKKTRLLALLLAAFMCLGLMAGCGNSDSGGSGGSSASAEPEKLTGLDGSEAPADSQAPEDSSQPEQTTPADNGGAAYNEGGEIKLGILGPLTGDVAVYGQAVSNGAHMYIDELNAAGGINGKQITIVEYDEKGDPTEAINAYNRLVNEDEVLAIIGDVTSKPTIAVADLCNADGVPMITASATAADVTSFGNYVFRACFLDPFQGTTMAKFASDELGVTKAAVIYNNGDDYSVGLTTAFLDTCAELGIEVVAKESYASADVDYNAQLTNIKNANPEILFCPDYYNTVVLIAQQARAIGIEVPLLGCDGWDGVLAVATDVSVLQGSYFSNHYSIQDQDPLIQNFLANYKATYGEDPASFAALGYDAAMILCEAIKTAGEDREKIVAALDATDMDCVTGHVTYDENNDPIKSCAIITFEGDQYSLYMKY